MNSSGGMGAGKSGLPKLKTRKMVFGWDFMQIIGLGPTLQNYKNYNTDYPGQVFSSISSILIFERLKRPAPPQDHLKIGLQPSIFPAHKQADLPSFVLSRRPYLTPFMPNRTYTHLSSYSASSGATGVVLSTWTPPLFFSLLSWNGNFHPPSSSGVLSHNRIRCLRGAGGG